MKKALILVLLIAMVAPIFADDALVMPAGVIRAYVVPTYAFASKSFDNDGKSNDFAAVGTADKLTVFNLGAAVEYGVNDWITAAVQWTPGWNAYSKLETNNAAVKNDLNINGVADLFVGAKFQIVGPKAPVQNEMFRFAVAPGVKFGLGGADFAEQATNFGKGDAVTLQNVDLQTLGIGARGYFDYVINDTIFANLYTQAIFFPGKIKAVDASFVDYKTVATVRGTPALGAPNYDPSFDYGYDMTFEFEPHYQPMIADGVQLQLSIPVNFNMTPARKVSDDLSGPAASFSPYLNEKASYILNVTPSADLFFMKTVLPMEIKLAYQAPVLGKNAIAMNALILQFIAMAFFPRTGAW